MTKMAEGAVALALDVTAALPLGMPKFIVATVAYSHLIPPERLAPDLMMILWAGGLFGLNGICNAILNQAAGAVVGACRSVELAREARPRVAISSLGESCLSYMVRLAPALKARGYEPVVFHCTGMGGRAMEALIAQGRFVAVFDFCLAEVANMMQGSVVNAGPERLRAAGLAGVPQPVAPGASDMVDVQTWATLPEKFASRAYHAHNRLIASVSATTDEKRNLAQLVCERLGEARVNCAAAGATRHPRLGHGGPTDARPRRTRRLPRRVSRCGARAHRRRATFSSPKALTVLEQYRPCARLC